MLYRFVSKIVFLFVLLGLSNSFLYAEGSTFTYEPPLIPVSFSLNNNEISVNVSRKWVTPIGVFSWGYEAYKLKSRSDYQPDYTYVVIKSKTTEKEYIYKVNDGNELRFKNRGECEVLIRKNRVFITVGKGSSFKAEFDVVGGNRQSTSKSSGLKWLDPSKSTCERYGGEMYKGVCQADWYESNKICSFMSARLPTVNELNAVTKTCGGTPTRYGSYWDSIIDKNKANSSYQSCYKRKGFSDNNWYWSSTSVSGRTYYAWIVGFYYGNLSNGNYKDSNNYLRCVRAGE